MNLSSFDYNLPKEMIATEPAKPRDAARLFVYNRLNTKSVHERFFNIGKFLQKGDVLVLNDTKVIPARLIGRLIHNDGTQGRKFKILLLERKATPPNLPLERGGRGTIWKCLIDGKGREVGLKILFSVIARSPRRGNLEIERDCHALPTSLLDYRELHGTGGRARNDKDFLQGEIVKKIGGGIWEIRFNKSGKSLDNLIFKLGQMPLPPYIKPHFALGLPRASRGRQDKIWYQTVFAKYAGSVAAPTAGLHFTPRLMRQLKKKGVKIKYVTLHVGMGTFLPVKTEKIEEHKMHEELAIISPQTAKVLNTAKKEGRRIVACGTTVARTLESFAVPSVIPVTPSIIPAPPSVIPAKAGIPPATDGIPRQARDDAKRVRDDGYIIRPGQKRTNIFIYPPYEPKFVDALITNFHLPKSTLMMLVSAFLSPGDKKGIKILQNLYAEAIRRKYRFYSYGDAILIN